MPKLIHSNFREFAQAACDNLEVGDRGAIIWMAALAVRRGLVKKRERETRREERASVLGVSSGAGRGLHFAPELRGVCRISRCPPLSNGIASVKSARRSKRLRL